MKRVNVLGEAYSRTYDYECDMVSLDANRAVFATRTDPSHEIVVEPRYVGGQLGVNDYGSDEVGQRMGTVCQFYFDGEYLALASYVENDQEIRITPREW